MKDIQLIVFIVSGVLGILVVITKGVAWIINNVRNRVSKKACADLRKENTNKYDGLAKKVDGVENMQIKINAEITTEIKSIKNSQKNMNGKIDNIYDHLINGKATT